MVTPYGRLENGLHLNKFNFSHYNNQLSISESGQKLGGPLGGRDLGKILAAKKHNPLHMQRLERSPMHVILYNWFCLISFVLPADEKHPGGLESDHLLISLCMGGCFLCLGALKCLSRREMIGLLHLSPGKNLISQKRKEPHRWVTTIGILISE